jgi:hypothetical protein
VRVQFSVLALTVLFVATTQVAQTGGARPMPGAGSSSFD